MSQPTPANWYPDPTGRNELRYWNGTEWTEHVSSRGVQAVDPVHGGGGPAAAGAAKVQAQVAGTGLAGGAGGGTIWTEQVLVVNQKRKLVELTNQYDVFDQRGNRIGAVTQVGQSAARKALRLVSNLDQFLTHTLEVQDATGGTLLTVTRPRKVMKSRFVVSDGQGRELGGIRQDNVFGKIRFELTSGEQTLGWIKAENWRAWNFRIEDATGTEIARITKTWEGLVSALFTTADCYVVRIHRQLPQPLHALVVASALSVDTALKQDASGLN